MSSQNPPVRCELLIQGTITGGTPAVTLTQYLNIYNQLRRGSRYSDIRPVIGNEDGDYYCGQYGMVLENRQGAKGARLTEVVDQTNQYEALTPCLPLDLLIGVNEVLTLSLDL